MKKRTANAGNKYQQSMSFIVAESYNDWSLTPASSVQFNKDRQELPEKYLCEILSPITE